MILKLLKSLIFTLNYQPPIITKNLNKTIAEGAVIGIKNISGAIAESIVLGKKLTDTLMVPMSWGKDSKCLIYKKI